MITPLYPKKVPEKARQHTGSIFSGPIPDESELTAGVKIVPGRTYGFFTDTSLCIGCKACEVACKEWNMVPEDGLALTGMSYDNTVGLGADTWRHVAFIEQRKPVAGQIAGVDHSSVNLLQLAPDGSGTPPGTATITPTTPGPGPDGS